MSIKSIFASIEAFLGLIKNEAETALTTANKFVNRLLAFTITPTGQTIENILETVIPNGLINATKLWLPQLFIDLKWATAEAGKTTDQLIAEGIAYLGTLTGDIKAAQANTLAALTSKFISDNTGAGLTIQQTLIAAQSIHALPTL